MMAQSRAESTRDTYNYGQYLNQFPPNTIKVIREFERIQKKICRHKMSIMFNEICIYIYIYIYIYIIYFKMNGSTKSFTSFNIYLFPSYILYVSSFCFHQRTFHVFSRVVSVHIEVTISCKNPCRGWFFLLLPPLLFLFLRVSPVLPCGYIFISSISLWYLICYKAFCCFTQGRLVCFCVSVCVCVCIIYTL